MFCDYFLLLLYIPSAIFYKSYMILSIRTLPDKCAKSGTLQARLGGQASPQSPRFPWVDQTSAFDAPRHFKHSPDTLINDYTQISKNHIFRNFHLQHSVLHHQLAGHSASTTGGLAKPPLSVGGPNECFRCTKTLHTLPRHSHQRFKTNFQKSHFSKFSPPT